MSLIALLILTQCKSTKPKYQSINYGQSRLATPPHNMARHDYPFDQQGRYRKDWVRSPSKTSSSSSRSSSSRSTYSAPKPKPKPARYHTVKSGDTLFAISRRYGTTVPRLKSVNGLTSDLIRTGQSLRIP